MRHSPLDHFRHLESRMNTRFLKFQDFFLPSFLPTLEGGDCNDGCRSNDSHNAVSSVHGEPENCGGQEHPSGCSFQHVGHENLAVGVPP